MSRTPLVSIIIIARIPTYFEQALKSSLAQDYANCEILIADSSSENFIGQIAGPYLNQSGHPVRLFKHPKEQEGVFENAVREAQGDYVKFLADADWLEPETISQSLAVMHNNDQVSVAATRRVRANCLNVRQPDILSNASLVNGDALINGEDLLRFQCSLRFNVIGEMSVALFRRADLLSLIEQYGSLFAINDENMLEVEALVLYARLLPGKLLGWVNRPLCTIRISSVYQQPGQRDNEEKVVANRDKVFHFIRQQSWFSQFQKPHNMVRVAAIHSPDAAGYQNFSQQHYNNFIQSELNGWLAQRQLRPFEQDYLAGLAAESGGPVSVGVVITVSDDTRHKVNTTLESLNGIDSGLLTLTPLIVGSVDRVPAGVSCYPATAENRLEVINLALTGRDEAWFIFVDAGSTFLPSGLISLATALPDAGGTLALYADEFFAIDGDPGGVAFRPDFNLDLFLSSPKTMAEHWLFRRELLTAAEGFDLACPNACEFDLIAKLIESQGFGVIGHLAEPLLMTTLKKRVVAEDAAILQRHLTNRGYPQGEVAMDNFGNYRLRYQHDHQPLVSLIILANWHLPSLIASVTTLLEKTRYLNYEMIIVADNQQSPERESWLASIANVDPQRIKVLHYPNSWHHAGMSNLAATVARGEYLALLHCELAVMDGEWLDNLLNHAQRPEVGIVGGKQLNSQYRIRHAGYLLGVNGAVGDAFRGMADDQPSYLGRLQIDQNYSAVSGDFMLVRRQLYDALGGFDTSTQMYDDVDFCLRAREQGYLTVWTPYARILRPAARQQPFQGENSQTVKILKQDEDCWLYRRWLPAIANDPAFNANLSLKSRQFDVNSDSALCWSPVKRPGLPTILANHADTAGCGHYRIIQPFRAMEQEGMTNGKLYSRLLSIAEIGQHKPDSMIIQRRYSDIFQNWMAPVVAATDIFRVYELDDYILNVPLKNHHHKDFKQDMWKKMRKSLGFFDRFVVSTEPLAEAFKGMHNEIVVVNNRLPVQWWGNLQSLRRQGKKPRVGWAGGSSHTGDLEMIVDVIKEFANEVEWVFMGMCPHKLRPYIHELHYGVDIEIYPTTLAALNLDLALAPVEDNIFNACKSNLRLMEYGACGVPVICSDVECYRGDLPVTRVRNRFKDWCDAIRKHLNDLDATAAMGDELQTRLRRDWMLTGDNAAQWLKAWTVG
ncbi:glycosyltransferase [Erwinia psidii]|uniref:Glycosyltransferase n=1 Tax=Erwinia psidii TaxID=69224 RepID=A0A3N6V2J1_9GAMM|nr:glycosyltransferase [Erwinia psidii]MCX8956297.1 glycosyltransferase [Erwinia psidii]MCX8959943.1 glycosyltransferase [Erwinia psidii]MCX8963489.1 glycosyltransferase [Erwinia psidii]RQM39295.1 glycosyltransferase [Erwinia psidii]